MHCEKVKEMLSDYCEGKIATALLVPLESHLKQCEICGAELKELKLTWKILSDVPVIEPPSSLRSQVWRKLETERLEQNNLPKPAFLTQLRRFVQRPVIAWSAAVLFLILLAGVTIPGKYMPAGFPTPLTILHMFHSRSNTPLSLQIEGITPSTNYGNANLFLNVRVNNTEDKDIPVTFSLSQQGNFISGNQLVAPSHRHFSFRIPIRLVNNQNQIVVTAAWKEYGKSYSKSFPLAIPTQ